jgi:rubredoxin-NAD+ reductase
MSQTIVIVGSGLAGYSLAKEFRQLNKEADVVLITADRGDYYSKPQLSTALNVGKSAGDLLMNTAEQMAEKLQITVVPNKTVRNIDRENKRVLADHYECQYDQLVLALGADKLSVPLDGSGVADVQSVNTLEEYEVFRTWLEGKKRIGILGSGLVGCEFANDLANGGYEVEVMAPDHYPLQRFVPEKIGVALQEALSEKGVNWHMCRFASEVNKVADGYEIIFDNMQKIKVDGVFSAIGLKSRTQLADQANLVVEKGVVTNELLQTSDPNIYAFGDCAQVCGQVLLHIAPLLICARALAKTLNGTPTAVHYPAMPILIKTPACPINTCPPYLHDNLDWKFTGQAPNLEAQCVDSADNLLGFALSGNTLRRRAELLKLLPDLF